MGQPLKPCPSGPAHVVGHDITMFACVCLCACVCVCAVLCTWQLMVHAVDRNHLVLV